MTQVAEKIDLNALSLEELEALTARKKQQEINEKIKKRNQYESDKNELVNFLVASAWQEHHSLKRFKGIAFENCNSFYEKLKEYGDVAESNKGNFTLKSADGTKKVEYSRQVIFSFDERADMAEKKLKSFLAETVKKRDQDMYELITSLLDRTNGGELDPRNIAKLYKYEEKFNHPLWKDAIKLFKESYQESDTSHYIRFSEQDAHGNWQRIVLEFSKI